MAEASNHLEQVVVDDEPNHADRAVADAPGVHKELKEFCYLRCRWPGADW